MSVTYTLLKREMLGNREATMRHGCVRQTKQNTLFSLTQVLPSPDAEAGPLLSAPDGGGVAEAAGDV